MKKTIVKTAIITFLILFVVSALVTVSVGAIRPALLGKFCSDLGIKNAAAFLYERQYDRTGDISDLKILVNASVAAGSEEKVAKYSYSLVADENMKFRETVKDGSEYRYYSFIAVESNYNVSDYEKSVDIAENYGYEKAVYNENSPFYLAVRLALYNSDKDYSALLINAYERGSFDEGLTELETDINKLKDI